MVEREPWGTPQLDGLRGATRRNRMNEISGECMAGCISGVKRAPDLFLTSVCLCIWSGQWDWAENRLLVL